MAALFPVLFLLIAIMFALVVISRTLQESWGLIVVALRRPERTKIKRDYRFTTVQPQAQLAPPSTHVVA